MSPYKPPITIYGEDFSKSLFEIYFISNSHQGRTWYSYTYTSFVLAGTIPFTSDQLLMTKILIAISHSDTTLNNGRNRNFKNKTEN